MTGSDIAEARRKGGIFISYRRDDAAGQARALHNDLAQAFGTDRIFMDVDNLKPGEEFPQKIGEAIESSGVALVLIGHNWLSPRNKARLSEDPDDFIRLEIETALRTGVPIIPILVERAPMPTPESLPESVRSLTRRQALELENLRWGPDVQKLIATVRPFVGAPSTRRSKHDDQKRARTLSPMVIAIVAAAVVAVMGLVIVALPSPHPPKSTSLSAASVVGPVPPARLLEDLVTQPLGTAGLPSDMSLPNSQLLVFFDKGLLAAVVNHGPSRIFSAYDVYSSTTAADSAFAGLSPVLSSFLLKSGFSISGITDPRKCGTSYSSHYSQWASSCYILSGDVIAVAAVISVKQGGDASGAGKINSADDNVDGILSRATVAHLILVGRSSTRNPLTVLPGALSPADLQGALATAIPNAALVPVDIAASVSSIPFSSPAPQGVVNDETLRYTIQGPDQFGDSADYLDFQVFDSAADAAKWYGSAGVSPSGSTPVSGFQCPAYAYTAHCGTWLEPASATLGTQGVADCSILDGDVVISARTQVNSTTKFGNEELAGTLGWTGLLTLDLLKPI